MRLIKFIWNNPVALAAVALVGATGLALYRPDDPGHWIYAGLVAAGLIFLLVRDRTGGQR